MEGCQSFSPEGHWCKQEYREKGGTTVGHMPSWSWRLCIIHNIPVLIDIPVEHWVENSGMALVGIRFIQKHVSFFQTKVALQLYQVDHKSYLLDYKSLPIRDEPGEGTTSGKFTIRSSHSSSSSLKEEQDIDGTISPTNSAGVHHTMEFLEMCANLIVALACWHGRNAMKYAVGEQTVRYRSTMLQAQANHVPVKPDGCSKTLDLWEW